MSVFALLKEMVKVKLEKRETNAHKEITLVPLDLSQESMVEIATVPMILATDAGLLVKELPEKHIVSAVGTINIPGIILYHSYLSNGDGAFLQIVNDNEIRLYTPYAEIIPSSSTDPDDFLSWNFWLDEKDGYIGAPIMQGTNEDGAHQYIRSVSPSNPGRIPPIKTQEAILSSDNKTEILQHRLMQYERQVNNLNEYLFVSAVESSNGASVNMWLGMDVAKSDLMVYPAHKS